MNASGGPTLSLTFPAFEEVPPDPAQSRLLELYAHPPGTVRVGMIASADGRAAGPDGSSRSLNGPADLRILRTLRAACDVVLVGGRTAWRESYADVRLLEQVMAWRVSCGMGPAPHVAVVTREPRLPSGLSPDSTWIVTTAGTPAAELVGGPWRDRLIVADPGSLVASLADAGLSRVLCEGGPELASWLFSTGDVTDYCLTRSPREGGANAPSVPPVPAGSTLSHRLEADGFVMERFTIP